MSKQLLSVFLAGLFLLSGWPGMSNAGDVDRSKTMFLRGVFTWWEADPQYQLKRVKGQLYKSEAKLKADGQPYSFKFADASWSSGQNCGFKSKEEGTHVQLDKPIGANCNASYDNFEFTPKETGVYEFYIDFTNESMPMVTVKKKP